MEIKKTWQIEQEHMNEKGEVWEKSDHKRWVAVDDIHKKIAEILTIADENAMFQQFFELQKELLKSLSTTDSKKES